MGRGEGARGERVDALGGLTRARGDKGKPSAERAKNKWDAKWSANREGRLPLQDTRYSFVVWTLGVSGTKFIQRCLLKLLRGLRTSLDSLVRLFAPIWVWEFVNMVR